MKNQNYYVGFDIGTDSVGYAVTDGKYNLCKHGGEPMWGVTLFDSANLASERRAFRTARRRLDRRQQRVQLVMDLFASEISKIDKKFFTRIKDSYKYSNTSSDKVRLFDSYTDQKKYAYQYPTIHHLIVDLMSSSEPHDVRLVYIACSWLVAHRGHFLSEVDKNNISAVTDFAAVWENLTTYLTRDEYALPWTDGINISTIQDVLKAKVGITKKSKLLGEVLFDGKKIPKVINEQYEYNYELVCKLLCGGKVSLKDLFGKDEYADLDEKSIALNMPDEKLALILQSIGDDSEFVLVLKAVYDWSVLVDVLKGKQTVSEAKVAVFKQHQQDLKSLKQLIKKYIPSKYNEVFRSSSTKNNYVDYIGKNKTANHQIKVKKSNSREDFSKYILSIVKSISADATDANIVADIIARLEVYDFLPKQVNSDNRVIPYQLYWYELNKVLQNASKYLPFLNEVDCDGITNLQKILSVFEFRVPYYVGPLKENPTNSKKLNCWMVRKAQGPILPWNFNSMVDCDASEEAFIKRMTNTDTYLPGEDVLPKNSLVYSAFEVLNEINNINIDGNPISVELKQRIYQDIFMQYDKVTVSRIKNYLEANGIVKKDNYVLSGIDVTIKSSLKSFRLFSRLVHNQKLSYADVENIINRATYSEDRFRYTSWLKANYTHLSDDDVNYISRLKFKEFGRLSRKLLCGIEGCDQTEKTTGEMFTVIRALWETNCNFMELLSDRFTFKEQIDQIVKDYYDQNPTSLAERLDEMRVSNAVKRPIIRTLDILKDIVKIQGCAPKTIFIEMARGSNEELKGKRTNSRLDQILELYKKVDQEDVRKLKDQLESFGDTVHNKLQSDKLFLYFIQLGKCLYTGQQMDIQSVMAGDGSFNIDHIYPRTFVKDDSVINNKVLVSSTANAAKGDRYPIDGDVQSKMRGYWTYLNKIGLISDEKFKRLTRNTHFTEEEKFSFINRQLVETRQSTKVVATLLNELYPNTQVVYVKANLASDFRQQFDLVKSRAVNDLHHAKDAYLNIVVGNVWHHKFSRQFWRTDEKLNAKPEVVFTRPVFFKGQTIWSGADDKDRVVKIARKNTARVTKYSFCRKGGFFDQMPVSAAPGLVPRKKDMPTEIYGGYNKTTATFFVLVRYFVAKKQDVMVMPVELLHANEFLKNSSFAEQYAIQTISKIINKPVIKVEFLLNRRILKVNTMLSLDGLKVCITGKSSGGAKIGVSVMEVFKTSYQNECYIRKLESFDKKRKTNANIVLSSSFDGITTEQNVALYDYYIKKLQNTPYKYRPANPVESLTKCRARFIDLSPSVQVGVLLQIQGMFGRLVKADLTPIGGVASTGVTALSSSISNWKKNYRDVRIIDQSASGLYETSTCNLLELL